MFVCIKLQISRFKTGFYIFKFNYTQYKGVKSRKELLIMEKKPNTIFLSKIIGIALSINMLFIFRFLCDVPRVF